MSQTLDIARVRERLTAVAKRLSFLGPTLARLTVGLVFIGTGWGKLHTLPDVTEYFASLHIPMPGFNARLAASTEFFGGVLVLVGLATRLAVLPMAFTMVIAILTAKLPDAHGLTDLVGFEEWSYLVFFIWLAVAGAGPLSLDHLLAPRLARWLERRSAPRAATA
ncbi:MAG TPA: DoxX family protein [Polyangia bacterium]|nr:DoxX family protein [Polyangia bacterium]